MSEDLLPYYNRELADVRRLGAQFAEAQPKIAGRLRLGPDSAEDPHVERLIEAFAYLNARTRLKLEDEFPEITESLLGVLYPHYQAPLPSMAVVEFELDPEQNELTAGHTVPRHALLETEPIDGEPCRFRTVYPMTLWPIALTEAALGRPPFPAPATRHTAAAASVLRLTLEHRGSAGTFAALELGSLRFFLKGQPQHAYRLYELILNHTLGVALASSPEDPSPVLLRPDWLRPVGFGRDEGVLPYTARSLTGYRLLTEYFAYPQKFLFIDLAGLDRRALARLGRRMEVYLYLDQEAPDLEHLSADNFRLGCTPVVNLYPKRAEPIQLTHTDFEYRVAPDARRPRSHEVYSIDRVTASAPSGEAAEYQPFFSVKHAEGPGAARAYWHAARRAGESADEGRADAGTEVCVSLVDLNREPAATADWTLDVETTCLNRDLPHRLPFGGGQPRLQLSEGDALVARVSCLTPPTPTLRPARRRGALWRLVSHLSLNHLSLVNEGKADALREILKLYDFADSPQTRQTIDGVVDVAARRVACRVGGAVLQGVEATLTFDEERFSGGLFLFASVLERFLALYCSVNSFTKLTARVRGREGVLRSWPPRTGERVLV